MNTCGETSRAESNIDEASRAECTGDEASSDNGDEASSAECNRDEASSAMTMKPAEIDAVTGYQQCPN